MRPGIKLFVGNVPEEATAEELSELFAGAAGPVLGIALMKQFAFVHLRDEAAAARAITQLNGHQLHGRRIVVEPSRPRPTNTCKIFVGNVSAACTSGELRSLFQQYGTVVECDVVKGTGPAAQQTRSPPPGPGSVWLDVHLRLRTRVPSGWRRLRPPTPPFPTLYPLPPPAEPRPDLAAHTEQVSPALTPPLQPPSSCFRSQDAVSQRNPSEIAPKPIAKKFLAIFGGEGEWGEGGWTPPRAAGGGIRGCGMGAREWRGTGHNTPEFQLLRYRDGVCSAPVTVIPAR